jgi:hypothetical protein
MVMLYEEKYHKHPSPEGLERVTHARTIRRDQVVGTYASYQGGIHFKPYTGYRLL